MYSMQFVRIYYVNVFGHQRDVCFPFTRYGSPREFAAAVRRIPILCDRLLRFELVA